MGEVPADAHAPHALGAIHHRFSIKPAFGGRGTDGRPFGQHKRLLSSGLEQND